MHAVQVRKPGPPGTHLIEEVPDLEPGAGQVRIDVRAAAVNYPDLLVITGRYQAIAHEDQCMPLPDRMGFVDAVALGLAAQTAWFALLERGGCDAGDIVLGN